MAVLRTTETVLRTVGDCAYKSVWKMQKCQQETPGRQKNKNRILPNTHVDDFILLQFPPQIYAYLCISNNKLHGKYPVWTLANNKQLLVFLFFLTKQTLKPCLLIFYWLTKLRFVNSQVKVHLYKAGVKFTWSFLLRWIVFSTGWIYWVWFACCFS